MQTEPRRPDPDGTQGPPPAAGEDVPGAAVPLAGDAGTVVVVPATSPAEERARGELLTGRAARLAVAVQSPTQVAWRRLRKNRVAMLGGLILIVLYTLALLAPFVAPYHYETQGPESSHPPMPVRMAPGPTVYGTVTRIDEFRERVRTEDPAQPLPLRLFVRGEPYRLFWVIPTDRHLFGVEGPRRAHLLGTDQYGRDYLSRLLYASQISLSVGLIGIAITFVLGLLVGGASGFYGGRVDDVIMRLCEVVMSVPQFYLLLTLAALLASRDLPPAVVYVMIIAILSLVGWAGMARVVRGIVLSVREREYVEAARALGVGDLKIIVRHILPSTLTFAIVAATLSIPAYILTEASLSYLSLGIKEPMPSWGNMLSDAQKLEVLEKSTWLLAPGFAIFLTTLAFNFLGDGLRDALDPKSK